MQAKIVIGDIIRKSNGTSVNKPVEVNELGFTGSVDLIAFKDGVAALLPEGEHIYEATCDFCAKPITKKMTTKDVEMTYYLHAPEPEIAEQTDYEMIDQKGMTIDLTELIKTAIETAKPLQYYCSSCENKSHDYKDSSDGLPNPFKGLGKGR
jgi:uncharacterized metal-binding protein YceD (DUF177 family)